MEKKIKLKACLGNQVRRRQLIIVIRLIINRMKRVMHFYQRLKSKIKGT